MSAVASFNPEPAATAGVALRVTSAVAVGSGLNYLYLPRGYP